MFVPDFARLSKGLLATSAAVVGSTSAAFTVQRRVSNLLTHMLEPLMLGIVENRGLREI